MKAEECRVYSSGRGDVLDETGGGIRVKTSRLYSSPPQGLPRLFVDLQSWPALAFPWSLLGVGLAAVHYRIRILRVELAVCT